MKRILLSLLLVCSACALSAGHYQPVDKHTYSSRATIIAQVYLDGQLLTDCEVGAFDQNGECRGADAEHGASSQNTVWLYIYGQQQNADVISFRVAVFDENGNYEREYTASQQYTFRDDDIIGSVSSPYIIRIQGDGAGTPPAHVNANYFATYSCAEDVKIKTTGVKAYKAVVTGEEISLIELNGYIPAGTGVVIYGENNTGKVSFEAPGSGDQAADNLSDNALQATTTATVPIVDKSTVSGTVWVLGRENKFQRYSGSRFASNRAFLVHEPVSEANEMRLVFDEQGNTNGLEHCAEASDASAYDLQGRMSNGTALQIKEGTIIINLK